MARAARSIAGELRGQVDEAADGRRRGAGRRRVLAVGREGLETALFLWAAAQAAPATRRPTDRPLLGAVLGLATAVVLGYLLYRGALKLNLAVLHLDRRVPDLVAAGVLVVRRPRPPGGRHPARPPRPGLRRLRRDPAGVVVRHPAEGHFNFSPATTWLEALAWVLYVVPTMALFLRQVRRRTSHPRRPPPPSLRHQPDPTTLDPEGPHASLRPALLLAARPGRPGRSPPAPTTHPRTTPAAPATPAAPRRPLTVELDRRAASVSATGAGGKLASTSRTTATRSPSSTCSPRTACGSSARWRTSARASPATRGQRAGRASTSPPASRAWSATASAPTSPSPTPTSRSRSAPTTAAGRPGQQNYAAYVQDQTEQLLAGTEQFAAAYKAGDDDKARAIYAAARMHWERIEPVAESFGDLDPSWTPARPTSSRARSGPAGTGSRRTCGRRAEATRR